MQTKTTSEPSGSRIALVISEPVRLRDRHRPRLCRSCQAPMAGHEVTCWRCGVQWGSEEAPLTTLRLVPAPTPDQAADEPQRRIEVAAALPAAVARS